MYFLRDIRKRKNLKKWEYNTLSSTLKESKSSFSQIKIHEDERRPIIIWKCSHFYRLQISWYLPFCKLYSWNNICFKCQICLQYSLNLDTIFLENLPKIDYAWNVKILCIQNSVNLSNPATDLSKSEQRDLHHFHHRMVDIHRAGCKRWPRYSTRLRLFRKVSGRGPREPRILKSELITGFYWMERLAMNNRYTRCPIKKVHLS